MWSKYTTVTVSSPAVFIDYKLSWKSQISSLCGKLSSL